MKPIYLAQTIDRRLILNRVLGAIVGLLLILVQPEIPVTADTSLLYVAPDANCGSAIPCYATLQAAVDAASEGAEILVAAGTYEDINEIAGLRQLVYLNKSVMIRGGYNNLFTASPDPDANPTRLDAQGNGRVFTIVGDINTTIQGLSLSNGDATLLGGSSLNGDAGGSIYILTATVTIDQIHISSSTSVIGGAIYLGAGALTMKESQIDGAKAIYGGGLYATDSILQLVNNEFTKNYAQYSFGASGGALFAFNSDVKMTGNRITENVTQASRSISCGGARLSRSTAILANNIITGNQVIGSLGWGGGLCLDEVQATLNSNIIADNLAGLSMGSSCGGLSVRNSRVALSYNLIARNGARRTEFPGSDSVGGGLCLQQSQASFMGDRIIDNFAGIGGGAYIVDNSAISLTNTVIANNQAGIKRLFVDANSGLSIDNTSAHFGNVTGSVNYISSLPTDAGSGLYIGNSIVQLVHTTIASNYGGTGSGLYVDAASQVALTNTILVSHTVGITVTGGSIASLTDTLWGGSGWSNITDWGGSDAIITGTINLWGNPAFIDPGIRDYHIQSTSAAVDAGVDAGVAVDMDNEPRPYQTPDLGADEYRPTGILHTLYLPLVSK